MILARRTLPGAAILLTCTSICANMAQAQTRHMRGDTVHVVQSIKNTQDLEGGPMGSMSVNSTTDMTIAVRFEGGDTITFWVEKAAATMTAPTGDMSPDVSALVNKPYLIVLNADGTNRVIKAPEMPKDLADAMTSLVPDNDALGFQLKHPVGPLTIGMMWTDTIIKTAKPDAPQKVSGRIIRTSKVTGDTTVAGNRALIIETAAESDVNVDMAIEAQGMTVKSAMKSTDKGRLFYSPDLRMVIEGSTTGAGAGTQNIEGPMSIAMTSKGKTETTIHLVH